MTQVARADIGFKGGQVLSLRIADDVHDKLITALRDAASARWHVLALDDEQVSIDLTTVVYVRRHTGDSSVGF